MIALTASAFGINVECIYEEKFISVDGNCTTIYTCTTKNFHAPESLPVPLSLLPPITQVTGRHLPGRTNSDVRMLIVKGRSVKYFPREFARFLPNVQILLVDSRLSIHSRVDLGSFRNQWYQASTVSFSVRYGPDEGEHQHKYVHVDYSKKDRTQGLFWTQNCYKRPKMRFHQVYIVFLDHQGNPESIFKPRPILNPDFGNPFLQSLNQRELYYYNNS